MTGGQGFTVKTHYVWFTLADWQAFSDALAEAYPQARYDIRPAYEVGPDRPEVVWESRIADVPTSRKGSSSWAGDIPMIFDPAWQPTCTTYRLLHSDPPDTVRWGLARTPRTPLPFVRFGHRTAPDANELATMTRFDHSDIHYFCPTNSKPAAAEARRFFRLVEKFCTNRNQALYELEPIFGPGSEFVRTEAKGSWFWLGYDAIRWARESPDRIMRYLDTTGIRPCTEEEMAALAEHPPPAQES